jgi:hypothetical protein
MSLNTIRKRAGHWPRLSRRFCHRQRQTPKRRPKA